MRRGLIATLVALGALAAPAHADGLRAGAAAVDASWHVGASAGQYASDGTFVDDQGIDPGFHSIRRQRSYGIQSRLSARALVIEGPDGNRVALVKNDLYIPQDLLWRRTAQVLEQGDSGIGKGNLTMAVTHDHSSPMYSSTSWGVWAFQDVFDVRFYNYYARRMAEAVERAAADLRPVRVGASVSYFDKTHRHSFGPAIADDGTPAGYPQGDTDHDMTVVRFDDVSDPRHPKPLANLVNFSLHPEFLNGNDLISADYVAPLQRMVDRETGALTIWTQGAVGTSEPERSAWHSINERLEFSHREYAQAEYGARLMADAVVRTWKDVGAGTPEDPQRFIPFTTSADLGMEDRWFPGPLSHPYPGVSNCRTDPALGGEPRVPVVGLPDCEGPPFPLADPGLTTDDFERAGIPVPENYSAPSYTGLEEDVSIHLQAIRLGDILFTVCSCEQWADQSRNIETRTNRAQGDEYLGYDWKAQCRRNGDGSYGDGPEGYGTGTWTCPDPRDTSKDLPPLSDQVVERMHRQVTNPADGWNDPDYVTQAESEPTDLRQIKGNYTHDELPPELGYRLTVPISMANDYNGYIATYREYSRGDHYRKALTGWGPHSSDYMASRLVGMGGHLNGGPDLPEEPLSEKSQADLAVNDGRAQALGSVGESLISAYESALPDDAGPAEAVSQPKDVERFAAAFFTWVGGSNYTDNPEVTVQRFDGSAWRPFADQSGEVPVTLKFPEGTELGSYRWEWTAYFEAFASDFDTGSGRATPAGRYRFVVDGLHREGGEPVPYRVVSAEFGVSPWSGITVDDLRVDPDGRASFRVGPRTTRSLPARTEGDCQGPAVTGEIGPIDYPDTYASPAPFIRRQYCARHAPDGSVEWYCFTCSFRPWADAGDAQQATFTFGGGRRVAGVREGDRWVSERPLRVGEGARVAVGDVRDAYGNLNGRDSGSVTR